MENGREREVFGNKKKIKTAPVRTQRTFEENNQEKDLGTLERKSQCKDPRTLEEHRWGKYPSSLEGSRRKEERWRVG